jgi:PAS domain S-box-containing protein
MRVLVDVHTSALKDQILTLLARLGHDAVPMAPDADAAAGEMLITEGSRAVSRAESPFALTIVRSPAEVGVGADDWILAPFEDRELELRVRAAEQRIAVPPRARDSELIRTTVQSLPDFISTLDPEGRFLFLNRMHRSATHTLEQVIGTSIYDWVAPEHRPNLEQAIAHAFMTREPQTFENVGAPGTTWYRNRIFPIFRDDRPSMVVVESREINAEKRATEQAEQREARARSMEETFRLLIETLPDCVLVHRKGVCVYVNPASVTSLGYDSAFEIVGRPILDLAYAEDRARMAQRFNESPRDDVEEFRLIHKSGSIVTFEVAPAQPLDFEGERATLVVGRNVTQRKEIQQRLLASERMASMGTLASCIAHEINNPLTYVVGNLSYIADGLSTLAQTDATGRCRSMERAVADVREGVDRVRSVVGDLSTLSQPEHDLRKPLDVRRVLESSINVAKNEIRHRARLEREYAETPLVVANEALLGQVFLNLLLNAARAIPEGSADRNVVKVSTHTDLAGRAVIEIRDTGSSVTPDDVAQLFETTQPRGPAPELVPGQVASETGEGRGGGVGLSLAICHTIITGLGGTITVESDREFGAVFRMILPAAGWAADGDGAEDRAEQTPPVGVTGRARILVVDDEPVIAATMRRALDAHDVYFVTSGRDALELCRGEAFDLVLCDLMLPDLTGMDLYEALREDRTGRERQIVFMTGGAFTPRARRFLASVPNPWLKKPFDAEDIQSIVQRCLVARLD